MKLQYSDRFLADKSKSVNNSQTQIRRLSSWVEIDRIGANGKVEKEQVKLMKRTDIPQVIYIRSTSDVVKQLSSIGRKTYLSQHKSPYGDALDIVALSTEETLALWEDIKSHNLDKLAPCNNPCIELAPKVFIYTLN